MTVGIVRTGYVKATGWALKLRKVANAVMKSQAESSVINEAVSELNQKLFDKLNELGVDRDDVVYIEIPYMIKNGEVKWLLEGAKIRIYKLTETVEGFV